MRNVLFSNNFAIMTAENPMHPVSMQGGNQALENELNKKGFKFYKIKGKYGGNPENSYLIENPDHQTIIDLGKKFGQDSVIVSKGGQHKMVYTNGPDAGKHHLGNSIETFEKPPEDYYSTGVDNGKPFHFSINFDMDTKHADEMNKSQPQYLVHFSTTPGLKELDPMMQGSAGRHSPETKHGRPEHPRVYFYEEGTPTESVVTGGAKAKYIVKHPGSDKIYDIAKDPHGLQQQAKEQWLQKPIGSMQDAYFKLLKDKGYMGFKNSSSGLPNVVALFHKTPVHAEVPAPADMSADKTWTEASVPDMKKSDIKQAVKEIKGSAKVNEVLAEAPADQRSKILAALRKEKLEKMNGTGVSGAGGATPPMMQPPVPAAPAMSGMAKAEESESRMAKKDLKDIMEYAQALDGMVVESEDLEDWVDSKITVARQYLSDIAHYLSYEHGQPTEELDKGDVISMKDKKVISTDTKAAPKELVAAQPKAAKNERALAQRIKSNWEGPKPALAKSDSKKAKFERCVMAVKKKSGKDVNPWAVCHASVDGAKKSESMEKAELSVKEQEKPTKGMPQAKQLKADADLEKIKEGAENVAKAADKKKSELKKSTGYFKQNPKTQVPEWHDPLKQQREDAAKEEAEVRPAEKAHIWAMLEREHQMSQKPKAQKPKEELEKAKAKPQVGTPEREEFDTFVQQVKGRDKEKAEAAAKELKSKYDYHENEILRLKQPTQKQKEIIKKIKERREKAVYGRNYKRQQKEVWGTYSNPKSREKEMKMVGDFAKKTFGLDLEQIPQDDYYNSLKDELNGIKKNRDEKIKNKTWTAQHEKNHKEHQQNIKNRMDSYVQGLVERGVNIEDKLGKKTKAGIYVNKPGFSNPRDNIQHTGTTDSAIHELAHLIFHGALKSDRDKERASVQGPLPHFQRGFQKQLDEILGDIQRKYNQEDEGGEGYGKQWQTAHEYIPLAIEQLIRRHLGLPAHQKKVSEQKVDGVNVLKPEKQFAVDVPNKQIVHVVKNKAGKDVYLTGKTANITPEVKQKIEQIVDKKELEYTPEEGFVQGTSPDAKINIRAREAAKDKSRKDADTLMRSEELQKKLILGEGKPSKATKKATPEEHKAIMDKLSAALDTVKVDQSPEASEERKMLLEHVKNKLKGRR